MAEITKELGRVPISRGEFNLSTTYYKDNIVQYKRGSYQVVSKSPIIGVSPTNDKNVVNPGWTLFAGTLDAQDVVNQVKDQEIKSIQAVATREAEILAKSNAAELSFDNTDTIFSGTNVQDALKETNGKLSELESEVIYDVTANNNGATFFSLSALLSSNNLSTLIPTSVRHGGMSIRFVQSSDNKYVQYRLMPNEFSNTKSDWQGVDDSITIGSNDLAKSGEVANHVFALTNFKLQPKALMSNLPKYKIIDKNARITILSYNPSRSYNITWTIQSDLLQIQLSTDNVNAAGYFTVFVAPSTVEDTYISYHVDLYECQVYASINWYPISQLKDFNVGNGYGLIPVDAYNIPQENHYPFNGGKKFNLNLFKGIKDVFIPNIDPSKHYFISRISCIGGSQPTEYRINIGRSDSFDETAFNTWTNVGEFVLTKSDYSEADIAKDMLLESLYSYGSKILVNIKQLIDSGYDFAYYSPVSDSANIDLDLTATASRIMQYMTKEKADGAVQSVKTINGNSIEGTGNIVIETGVWDDIQNKPNFAQVATSGSYTDLTNKPVITNESVIIDSALDLTSENPVQNKVVTAAVSGAAYLVTTIAQLKAAIIAGRKNILLDTNGSYIELGEKITIPDNTSLSGYNGFVKRQSGYDGILFEIGNNVKILGLTIDGNRSAVVAKDWSTAIDIKFSGVYENKIGSVLKDCHIIHGTDGVMYMGWHNIIENCIFEDMASAGVHYSGCYHSIVRGCTFRECCQEAVAYGHSEGALLWSNYCEGSIVSDNYFIDCAEMAIGGIDAADNNTILIQCNKCVRTKGIGGNFEVGNSPYNITIRDNICIDNVYVNSTYGYGIYLTATKNTYNQENKASMYNVHIENNLIVNGGLSISATDAIISGNRVYNFKYEYNGYVTLTVRNTTISNNVFLDGNWGTNGGFRISGVNNIIANNVITSENRGLYFINLYKSLFKYNYILSIRGNQCWNQNPASYKVDFIHNIIVRAGYNGNAFIVPDGSLIENNMFVGSTSEPSGKLLVSAASKDVILRNNKYNGSITYDGTSENGCINEGNVILSTVDSHIQVNNPYTLTNISANDDWYVSLLVGIPFFTRLVPVSGYVLPNDITINYTKPDGTTGTLIAGEWSKSYEHGIGEPNWLNWTVFKDYIYDKTTGFVFVPSVPVGMKIVASGVAE